MKRIFLLVAILGGICLQPIVLPASEGSTASGGFSFDARTLKLGTWLDDYEFDGFKVTGNNGIIDTHGYTSDADKTVAMLDITGFNVTAPAKIEILMSYCHDCDIELRSNGSLICSVRQGHSGGTYLDFENTGYKRIGKGKNATHVFEIKDKGIRLTSNGAFINARRIEVGSIDQVIIRGLKRENVDTGRSHLFQISATGKTIEANEPDQDTAKKIDKDNSRESAKKIDKDYGRESAKQEDENSSRKTADRKDKDLGRESAMKKKEDVGADVLRILTE